MTVCKLDTNVLHPMRAKLSHASFPLYVGINSRASYTTLNCYWILHPPEFGA